jgi:hypothetical protein
MYISSASGKCMEVSGDARRLGSPILLADCDARKYSQWFRGQLEESKGQIVTKAGLCLDVGGWSLTDDTQITQWDCVRQANEMFTHSSKPVTVLSAATKSVMDTISQDVLGISDPDPDICWKNTTTRGVGRIPTTCPAGYPDYDGALVCYQSCQPGYTGVSWVCWQNCPPGFTDIGVSCAKPSPYGRGTGYGWWFESPISRCQRYTGQSCEMWGLLAYPRCAPGYYAFGCCICSPLCPAGMRDDGAFCAKNTHTRGSASTTCAPGAVYDAGLCYPPCPSASTGVGPVCWGNCGGDFPTGCGAACAKSASACAFSIIEQVQSTADIAINVAGLVLTGGTANAAYNAARTAGRLAGKKVLAAEARQLMKKELEDHITSALSKANKLRKVANTSRKLDQASQVSDTAEVLVKAYEEGEFDWKTLVPTTAADVDPTGILGLVRAFNKPICQ